MNRTKSILSLSPTARVRIAGTASGLAVLLALGQAPQAEKATEAEKATKAEKSLSAAPRVAVQAALRSYAYYPEQLAALQSLGQFQPIADSGQKPAPQALALAVAVRPAAGETKPGRRAEPTAKLAAATAIPAPAPGSSSFPGVDGLRDAATRWSEAAAGLGGKIASLWR